MRLLVFITHHALSRAAQRLDVRTVERAREGAGFGIAAPIVGFIKIVGLALGSRG